MPGALAMTKGTTIPIESLEIQHLLADVTMPSLRHPYHTVEALHCTHSPHYLSQNLLYTLIGQLPLGTQTLTDHLFHHHHLGKLGTLLAARMCQSLTPVSQARAGLPPQLVSVAPVPSRDGATSVDH